MELIGKQIAIETILGQPPELHYPSWYAAQIEKLPPAQPAQLEQCPIYGGMCCYPSDQCYDCPRHAGAKMERGDGW